MTARNPAINEYLRQYYPPGTRLFKGAGEFREQNTWYEALTDQEQDVFRRFAWERIESRFPQTFRERLAWLRGTPPIVGYRAPPTARGNKTQQGRKRGRDAQDLENNSNGGDMQAPLPRRKKLRRSNRGMNAEVPAPSRPHPIPVREETTPHGVKRQRDDIEPATAEGDSDSQDVLEPPIKKSRQSADRETRVDSRSMPGAGLQPSSDSMLPMNLLEESQLGRDQHQRSEMGLLGLPRRQIRGRTQTRHRPRIAPRAPTASLSERGANTAHSSMTEEPHRQTGFAVFDSLNQSAAEPQEEADVGYRYPSPTRYEQPRPDSLSSGYGHQAQERSTSQTNRCSDSGYGSERALEEFRGEIWAQVNHDGGSPGGKHQTEMVEGQQPNGVSVDPHRHWNMFEPERNRSAVLEADDEGHDDYLVHEKAKSTKRRRRSPGQK